MPVDGRKRSVRNGEELEGEIPLVTSWGRCSYWICRQSCERETSFLELSHRPDVRLGIWFGPAQD